MNFVYCIHKFSSSEYLEFCDVTYREVIHHITVRWLSLQAAVERALLQYLALKSYFLSKGEWVDHRNAVLFICMHVCSPCLYYETMHACMCWLVVTGLKLVIPKLNFGHPQRCPTLANLILI